MYISIDQSTSSSTVFLYNKNLKLFSKADKTHKQIQKKLGYVEHDAEKHVIIKVNFFRYFF